MEKLIIRGGEKLNGKVRLAGAKNAVNKLLVASLLTSEPVTLANVPASGETDIVVELCESVGSQVTRAGGVLTIATPEVVNPRVTELTRKNRIPILALGPLLARAGYAEVPTLGGDYLGHRPVDFHIAALEGLGVKIEADATTFRAKTDGLRGGQIILP